MILLLFNSWDLKESNNTIYDIHDGGTTPWYVVRDLGGALGSTGTFRVKRNDIERFSRSQFVTGVTGRGFVTFAYRGKLPHLVRNTITVDDVVWATGLLAAIPDQQWRDAFRAAGYPAELGDRFMEAIRTRIDEAQRLAVPTGSAERR